MLKEMRLRPLVLAVLLGGCTTKSGHEIDELRVELPWVAVANPSDPKAVVLIVSRQELALDDRPLYTPGGPTHLTYAYWRRTVDPADPADPADLCEQFHEGLQLAAEFEAPSIELEIDENVDAKRLTDVAYKLGRCDATANMDIVFRVRTPAGLGTLRASAAHQEACDVAADAPYCFSPYVTLAKDGFTAKAFPRAVLAQSMQRLGCEYGRRQGRPQDHEGPSWEFRSLLENDRPWINWDRSIGVRLHAALASGKELAPACRAGTMTSEPDVLWRGVAPAISAINAQHGFVLRFFVPADTSCWRRN